MRQRPRWSDGSTQPPDPAPIVDPTGGDPDTVPGTYQVSNGVIVSANITQTS